MPSGNRTQPLGDNPPNLFVVDWFSNPDHEDVNLVNPVASVPGSDANVALFNGSDTDQFEKR